MMAVRSCCLLIVAMSAIFLAVMEGNVMAKSWPGQRQLKGSRQCRIQKLKASQPNQKLQAEGGTTEMWDQTEDQFICVGLAAMRNTIQPHSLSLPNYSPSPRLVYIEKGRGLLGISYPGCANTYQSEGHEPSPRGGGGQEEEIHHGEGGREEHERGENGKEERSPRKERRQEGEYETGRERGQERGQRGQGGHREQQAESFQDQHQKLHRIQQGDVVALPAGAAHWCLNDGHEELIALSVTDFNSQTNQLNQEAVSLYLAGGPPKGEKQGGTGGQGSRKTKGSEEEGGESWYKAANVLRELDVSLVAEALGISEEIVKNMQKDNGKGFIVKVEEGVKVMKPDDDQQEHEHEHEGGSRSSSEGDNYNINGLEDTICNMRINHRLDNPREADVFSRQAGRLNTVNMFKLPILKFLQMSAEKGRLNSNALFTPYWSMNAHIASYVTRGSGRVQVIGENGKKVLDQRVKDGELLVVPQYYIVAMKADEGGMEWVSFKTSALPARSPLAGINSAVNGMPAQILASSYGITLKQAQQVKHNRDQHMLLIPGSNGRSAY